MKRTLIALFLITILFNFCYSEEYTGGILENELKTEDMVWIWLPSEKDVAQIPPGTAFFRKEFNLPDKPLQNAQIIFTADDISEFFINGKFIGSSSDPQKMQNVSVKYALRTGKNIIAVVVHNKGENSSPAGLTAKLAIQFQGDEGIEVIQTDETWKVSENPPHTWRKRSCDTTGWENAQIVAKFGHRPWKNISSTDMHIPEFFPDFQVNGRQQKMNSLRELFLRHYKAARPCSTMWDAWLPKSIFWVNYQEGELATLNSRYRKMLSDRHISPEGYISVHQHAGFGHPHGWPFPFWAQSNGIGWLFENYNLEYAAIANIGKMQDIEGWQRKNVKTYNINDSGLNMKLNKNAVLTTPEFNVDSFVAPFVRLKWQASGFDKTDKPYIQWSNAGEDGFKKQNRMYFNPASEKGGIVETVIPLYKLKNYKGNIDQFRINFKNSKIAEVTIRMLAGVVDTRHPINNSSYIVGCHDYMRWTKDLNYLRDNIQKMRKALAYAIKEFRIKEKKVVFVPWVGHGGRSGIELREEGRSKILWGRGIGNNYWDLIPFGGKDCLATIYYYDVLKRFAKIERTIKRNPQWNIPQSTYSFTAEDIDELAEKVKEFGQNLFWNKDTKRFVSNIDINGEKHDFGFTFVNLEAIYYCFASDRQAELIMEWITDGRTVEGDTSKGEDIYHWEFAPRATTKRNLEYYQYVWNQPEIIDWGQQVQDGGAVLGWSYFDLMSRLKVIGPDNAWKRFSEIIDWYEKVQKAGGYRAYYSQPGTGSLQGGGTAGGLGIDAEFLESVLVPQVMMYGFLGFQPTLEGAAIKPQLPPSWPGLKITNVKFHGHLIDVYASQNDKINIEVRSDSCTKFIKLKLEKGTWKITHKKPDSSIETKKSVISDNEDYANIILGKDISIELKKIE